MSVAQTMWITPDWSTAIEGPSSGQPFSSHLSSLTLTSGSNRRPSADLANAISRMLPGKMWRHAAYTAPRLSTATAVLQQKQTPVAIRLSKTRPSGAIVPWYTSCGGCPFVSHPGRAPLLLPSSSQHPVRRATPHARRRRAPSPAIPIRAHRRAQNRESSAPQKTSARRLWTSPC